MLLFFSISYWVSLGARGTVFAAKGFAGAVAWRAIVGAELDAVEPDLDDVLAAGVEDPA
jgi:hypothetical protein